MKNEHPITPPPELVEEWFMEQRGLSEASRQLITTQAAQWGADQELEACCEWLVRNYNYPEAGNPLRAARRPKPPSLKEQALQAWAAVEAGTDDQVAMAVIRRALEALPE